MLSILGFLAAAFTTISFLPQAIKVIQTKNTAGISFGMYLILTTGQILWVIYGLITEQTAIWLANLITCTLAIIILKYTYKDLKRSRKPESK
ncbi:SemiSWEET family sugar transporter [Paenibacillus shunpengii]|uniref:SemiSWEET family sugar transporter n=1 Tax=Paenibacillus shunpengii TaxID=2054424 RepID=A0ABW5SQ65_9BACL|nr:MULTISPECIES: SemiSWEET transporter [unclassified Paenibacillus]OMC65433.1 hypothetical protein BK126_22285 [Paenibacillus sp. FSL H7-0326]SDX19665.1 MtN3 and saliva related transmembrane protein [Paenibacillus sp. PDC88]